MLDLGKRQELKNFHTKFFLSGLFRNFLGSLVVKTPCSNSGGEGSIPGWRNKIPQDLWGSQKKNFFLMVYLNNSMSSIF